MKILIPIKQVPDSTVRVKVAPDGKSVVTEGITWSISPYDEYAIEMALERKDADPATTVSVVAVGPARSRDALRQAIAMGCDASSWSMRRWFTRCPTFSSIHMRPPPAPQQKPRSR